MLLVDLINIDLQLIANYTSHLLNGGRQFCCFAPKPTDDPYARGDEPMPPLPGTQKKK